MTARLVTIAAQHLDLARKGWLRAPVKTPNIVIVTSRMIDDPMKSPWMSDEHDEDRQNDAGTITKTAPKTKRPSLYKVLLLNDDYTPQEFVIWLLEVVFHKGREEATQIMLHVHNTGVGICGVYTYEVAETKVAQVLELSRRNEHPLQCTMERE